MERTSTGIETVSSITGLQFSFALFRVNKRRRWTKRVETRRSLAYLWKIRRFIGNISWLDVDINRINRVHRVWWNERIRTEWNLPRLKAEPSYGFVYELIMFRNQRDFMERRGTNVSSREGKRNRPWRAENGTRGEKEGWKRDRGNEREREREREKERVEGRIIMKGVGKREREREREITDGQWQSFLRFSPFVRLHSRLGNLAINPFYPAPSIPSGNLFAPPVLSALHSLTLSCVRIIHKSPPVPKLPVPSITATIAPPSNQYKSNAWLAAQRAPVNFVRHLIWTGKLVVESSSVWSRVCGCRSFVRNCQRFYQRL